MKLRATLPAAPALAAVFLACLALAAGPARGAGEALPEGVTLPLAEYLDLVERARAAERATALPAPAAAAALAAQRVDVRVDGDAARLESRFEIDVRGRGGVPVALPVAGRIDEVRFDPATGAVLFRGAVVAAGQGAAGSELAFVTPAAGRHTVVVVSRVEADPAAEVFAIPTRAGAAPVSELRLDLPAEAALELAGAVPLEDRVEAGRRRVRLAPERGGAGLVAVRRGTIATAPAASAVARAVVVTHLDLRADEVLRLDTVLVEVLRGELASLEARLPPGAAVERAWMDDGGEVTVAAGGVSGRRKQRLAASGYLKILSRLSGPPPATLPLAAVEPSVAVRARYLVVSSSVAATLAPTPADAWSTIDLTDPPDSLEAELAERPPVAGWRLEATGGGAAGAGLSIALLPAVDRSPRPIADRQTATYVNADGSLLVQDRFLLEDHREALALTLPEGLRFESATVDGDVVRPIERNGRHLLPLRYRADRETQVEVALTGPPVQAGRRAARHRFELPGLDGEVLRHTWELFLPPGIEARYMSGSLRPVPIPVPQDLELDEAMVLGGPAEDRAADTGATVSQEELENIPTARDPWKKLAQTPGVLTDRINVGSNESGQQSFNQSGTAVEGKPSFTPVPDGTQLLLSGALPPRQVAVELEVRERKVRKRR